MSEQQVATLEDSKNLATLLPLSLRLLWRDWQGGELRLLFFALVMAVTSVTGIALFTDRLESALLLESANMLAADRVFFSRREAPEEVIIEAESRGLNTASTLSFTSMAFSDNSNMLVAAKAVSNAYPLRGELIVADAPFIRGIPTEEGPAVGEAWLESRALPALEIAVGDSVYLGEAELTVSKILIAEPDRQQGGLIDNVGPRIMLNMADVAQTNVVQLGSRVSYRYLFSGDLADLEGYEAWLREEYPRTYRLRDVRDESEEISDALNKAESFLLLGSLFAVLLAGIAIALTAKRYSERHYDYVAILKTLGCTSSQISAIYFSIQLVLATIAIVVGCLLGWLVHHLILQFLNSILQIELPPASFEPFVIGSLTAVVCLLSFALPPLLALRETPPLRVLRKDLSQQTFGANLPYIFGVLGAVFLIFWYSQDLVLTSVLVFSVAGIIVLLSIISYILLHSGNSVGMKAGSAWKLAMTAARRRRKQNVLQVMVFSVTIMSLLVLTLLRTDLISDWQAQLPEDTPNHFMMNITESQIPGIQAFFRENGVADNVFYPLISARVTAINGVAPNPRGRLNDDDDQRGNITESQSESNELEETEITTDGDESAQADQQGAADSSSPDSQNRGRRRIGSRQVTWAEQLPDDNRVTTGNWWDEDMQPGYVSIEESYADWLDIQVDDILEFKINQQTISAEVHNLRSVRWDNMQPNFYIIYSPGTINHLGATFLSTALMEREQKVLLNDLVRLFPTIVVIEIDALIEQVQTIIAQVTSAIELISALVLVCGALVLLSCVNATLDERFHENAILRTLGAGKRLILSSLFIEFSTIGVIAGFIATLGAEGSLYYLQEEVFEQDFFFHYWVWLAGPVLGMLVIAALGVNSTRKVVNISPLNVLRRVV